MYQTSLATGNLSAFSALVLVVSASAFSRLVFTVSAQTENMLLRLFFHTTGLANLGELCPQGCALGLQQLFCKPDTGLPRKHKVRPEHRHVK